MKSIPECTKFSISYFGAIPKLAVDVRGGGLYLGGAADPTYVRIGADGAVSELFLQNKDGKKRTIQP